jgi:D-amino-acid dehydrogenase
MDVTIIGGGVIGLSSAYYLNKAGYNVTVIDRGSITDGCSFGNMGYISPSHFVPLASPGIISQGLKWMLSPSSPFYIKPRLNADLIEWGIKFWKNSNAATVEKNTPHLHNLLQLSRRLIDDLHTEIGGGIDMQTIGCLMMCKQQKTLDHEFHLADEAEMLGLKVNRLQKADVQQLEPDVELNVAGAVLFKDDCHFHPGKMMLALKNYLAQKGVTFLLNQEVTAFEKNNGQVMGIITTAGKINCTQIVLAAGSWLPVIAKKLGIKLLLQPGKGYSYTYPHIEKNIKYPAILVDGRCAITPWGNSLRLGGTMELSGINNKILVKRMEGIYNSARDFYPGLKIDFPPADKIWSGLRPVTPDGLPYIGKHSACENVVIAGGHAMLGITLGTGTGKIVSEIVQRKTTAIDISAFRTERF